MKLHQMHQSFRAFAQQVGMQQVRGILPETIDLFLNSSISETVQTELTNSVRTAFQETANTQSSTMSAVNSIRTLYKTVRYTIMANTADVDDNNYNIVGFYNSKNSFHIINMPTVGSGVNRTNNNEGFIAPMMYLGFSIEFDKTLRGQAIACRMIGSDVLETTLRDFCNGATPDSPIVCLKSNSCYDAYNNEDIECRANEQLEIYIGAKGLPIKYLNVKYVKVPAVVHWDVDPDLCVDCDLPEYMHYGIIEDAVANYQKSITQMRPEQQQAQPNGQQQALSKLLGSQG